MSHDDKIGEFQVPPDLEAAMEKARAESPPPAREGRFLRGPVPMDWLVKAYRCGGAAGLAVGLELWHRRGLRPRSPVITLNLRNTVMQIPRRTAQRGIRRLVQGGLVEATIETGKKSVVRLLHGGDNSVA